MPRQLLTPAQISEIKAALARGESQSDISVQYGISQPTISRIKTGHLYPEVPWPDGSRGPLDEDPRVRSRLRKPEYSGAAARLMEHSPPLRGRILEVVNSRRKAQGLPEIPPLHPLWLEALNSAPLDDPHLEYERLDRAFQVQNSSLGMVMEEYEALLDAQVSKAREEAILEGVSSSQEGRPEPSMPPEGIAPPSYEKLPIDEILDRAVGIPFVAKAIKDKNALLLEAIAIVFRVAPRGDWFDGSYVRDNIAKTYSLLAPWPEIRERARKELDEALKRREDAA